MTRVLFAKRAMRKALVLSIGLHAGLFGLARPLILHPAAAASVPPPEETTDSWTGETFDLPGGPQAGAVYDVSLEAPAAPAAPAPPAPPSPPAVDQRAPESAPAVPEAPRPVKTASPATPSAETSAPKPHVRPRVAARSASSGSEGDHAGGGSPGSYGAEGPASVRDLRRAFVRALPAACVSDSVWLTLPLGDPIKLEVEIHVDESGRITRAEPRGEKRPPALVQCLRRTIPLIDSGTFAVRKGEVTEGTEILALRATVTEAPDAKEELGHDPSYEKAWFEPKLTGRRVEVTVKVLRVETR
jgi:hypothetical protein